MLSARLIQQFGLRIAIMELTLASFFGWDTGKKQLRPAHYYIYLTAQWGARMTYMFPAAHLLQIFLKTKFPDTDDYGNPLPTTPMDFATLVIAWGEVSISVTLGGIGACLTRNWMNIIYTQNQILTYNNKILQMLKSKQILLDDDHKKIMRTGDIQAYLTNFMSIVLPFGLLLVSFHPVEPTHRILQDWLEIDFYPRMTMVPWMILFLVCLYGCATFIVTLTYLVLTYTKITATVFKDLTPERIMRKLGTSFILQTRYYGEMLDTDIIQMYRELKLLNVLINDILGTVYIALHQVGCLGTTSIMIYFAIKFNHIIVANGFLGIFIVGGSMFTPVLIIWFQSDLLGNLENVTDGFKQQSKNLVRRRTMFARFTKSCEVFYVEVGYPFYKVHTETFLEFSAKALDYAVTLLLW